MKDVQLQPATCPTCDKFYNPSRRQRAKINPIPPNDGADILAIDVFKGKASLPETTRANTYILTKIDLITKFGVAGPMPDQLAQTVANALGSRWVLRFGAPLIAH